LGRPFEGSTTRGHEDPLRPVTGGARDRADRGGKEVNYLARWIFALQFPNRFAARYHGRSAAESRFATEKALFGDRLRCRRPASRRNEVPARGIMHNVRLFMKRHLNRSSHNPLRAANLAAAHLRGTSTLGKRAVSVRGTGQP